MLQIKMNTQRGLTLIELLVVVAILGVLSAIAIPAYDGYIIKTERKRAQLDLYQFQVYAEQYFTVNNAYPSQGGLSSCTNCNVSEEYIFDIDNTGSGNDAYVLKAEPKTTRQKKDSECYTMMINAASNQSNMDKNGKTLSDNTMCWL